MITTPRDEFEHTGIRSGGKIEFTFLKQVYRKKFVKNLKSFIYEEQEYSKRVQNMQLIKQHNLSYESEPLNGLMYLSLSRKLGMMHKERMTIPYW